MLKRLIIVMAISFVFVGISFAQEKPALQEPTQKLTLILDKTSIPADGFKVMAAASKTLPATKGISYEKPPENIAFSPELQTTHILSPLISRESGTLLTCEIQFFLLFFQPVQNLFQEEQDIHLPLL